MGEIKAQDGPQFEFCASDADIVIYGGAAGGGKSWALLLLPLNHVDNPFFGGVIFRRETTQITAEGAMWEQSKRLYSILGARPKEAKLQWVFPSGARVKFSHLEYEDTVYKYQGSEIPYIGFDELTHFTKKQFFYMTSRNRSTCGVTPYIRATCNPDPESWVRQFIDWWILKADNHQIGQPDPWDPSGKRKLIAGSPDPERTGRKRWYVNIKDELFWGATKETLVEKYGKDSMPLSVTFIPSRLDDNKILMECDPSYKAKLNALGNVDRERLLYGNWDIKPASGLMFRQEWFPMVDAVPQWVDCIRFWDRAATRPNEKNNDPDWTRGLLLFKHLDGTWTVGDLKSAQDTPGQVEILIKNVASQDGKAVKIMSQRDPGSAGVKEAESFTRMLNGYKVKTEPFDRNKVERAKAVSAQCEAHNVRVLRNKGWNEAFFKELEAFPDGAHDDIVDCLSGGYNELQTPGSSFNNLDRLARVMQR